jgi:hypothetical protein
LTGTALRISTTPLAVNHCTRFFGVPTNNWRNPMRKIIKAAGILAAAGILLTAALPAATADTVESTRTGGALTVTTSGATLTGVLLDGADKVATGTSSSPWSISDARGTGANWSLSVTASAPISAAGSELSESTVRTLPVGGLTITPGLVVASSGADAVLGISAPALAMSGSAQALVSAVGSHMGTYTLNLSYSLAVPANSYRSNYVGAVGSAALNPYVSTLTYTFA